jgi:hypothetical protein
LFKLGGHLASLLRRGGTLLEIYCKYRVVMGSMYRPRPDDLFIASYPKSGTTLLQMMLYQMTTDGEMDFPHIESVSPFFEEIFRHNAGKYLEELPSPRIMKTHLRYGMVPRGRSIYIVRDLRDVVVSGFHHYRMLRGWTDEQDFPVFVRGMLTGGTFFNSWFKHTQSWWPHRHDPNVLFLRYEEVIADLPGTMRKVAAFCNLQLTEEAAARVLERCSVAFMKQHNEKFDPRLRQLQRDKVHFIRNGVRGEGRTRLNPDQEQQIASGLADLGRKLGCGPEDPYADLFFGGRTAAVSASQPATAPGSPPPQIPPAR